ncbi:MAG: NUDIX hydrolase [Clostridia bacterium]
MKDEKFAIPGVAGIIIKEENDQHFVLIQQRCKKENNFIEGILEIPSGKVREFENIFDCLRREIKEETGLTVTYIEGEERSSRIKMGDYEVVNYLPFSCSQNIKDHYPIMVQVFICKARGKLLEKSDESKNIHWVKVEDLELMLKEDQEKFYPMHIDNLKKYIKLV